MIVRMTFVGIVKNSAGKKKGYRDFVDLHVASVADAKKVWEGWKQMLTQNNTGLRGDSGIYHPMGKFGEIQVEKFEEAQDEPDRSTGGA